MNQCLISNIGACHLFTCMLENHSSLVFLKLAFNRILLDTRCGGADCEPSSGDTDDIDVTTDLIERVNRKYGSLKLNLFGNTL